MPTPDEQLLAIVPPSPKKAHHKKGAKAKAKKASPKRVSLRAKRRRLV